ncbi:hypothetical protein [Comamonas sp. GB3 AK4-5]|uniref:hypothetical protein n=1 Tax=Comamonas sp. GB3 AK4-5 TaxID=3231487 RepID=UPI00351F5937
MAQLPEYVNVLYSGSSEKFDPGIIQSEMEKGLSKMRVGQHRVVVEQAAVLQFKTAEDSLAFEDWYFNTIRRIGFFTIPDARTGLPRSARFKNADIGTLEPQHGGYAVSKRSVTFEYLR